MRKFFLTATLAFLVVFALQSYCFASPYFNLPSQAEVRIVHPGTNPPSYWGMTFQNVSPGYSIGNSYYTGWCNDEHGSMPSNYLWKVNIYESYDPILFDQLPNDNNPMPQLNRGNRNPSSEYGDWDLVNWIINNRNGYNDSDVQNAIWWYVNGGGGVDNGLAQAASGKNGFIPYGQKMAVILEPTAYKSGTNWVSVTPGTPWPGGSQYVFIELGPVPVPEPGTLILLGSGLVGLAGYTKFRISRRKR